MNTKKMREKLRAEGHTPARSNTDMKKQYKEIFSKKSEPQAPKKTLSIVPPDNEYTYIGQGDEPPHMINFMGQQKFFRGDLTIVNNLDVLDKIRNNPCFVKGTYDKAKLFENDETAKKQADDQRFEDSKLQIEIERKQAKG